MNSDAILSAARRVLATEGAALTAMSEALPDGFAAAVRAIRDAPGRVVVAGVGKSGHVGRKIAATFASTGTPAMFVHPTEASHGDLGMIGTGDVCIVLSNSGETSELRDLIAYCRRFAIPLVAITSRAGSTVAAAADHALVLPKQPEACPMGLAPTTSTTMTMALGDALAVALMDLRGFTAEGFGTFHPGGKLGAQLARVSMLMHGGDDLPRVSPQTDMGETLIEMTSKGFGIAAVVGPDGSLQGVVTDGDLRRNMAGLMERTAGDVASGAPVTVGPDMLAAEALAILQDRRISVLMVTDDAGAPVGVLHIHDLLRAGVA
ncbi:Arabinose 5-phosphate isomerase KdsD [Rhodobacteraceae bacterium THAF1]|uniref:KpsF/GutQ family sugar-phosphate isomerase n=1 Tax=Palleronia sp. THAF1 TaxID=2587842 RepID=UPI000F4177A7|nr:KpsF/GutQ family sugar-phosphate isomerase [Palleronia sp. THAF1]QFU08929.1 Arabinose 5-phosphate isomerase KdsD [Palleronia sp. THAF1]VDC24348.1 Arabinose 5-phosphate isomerase KdsD [Rhodobacteraceae bacterium THAF1]